MACNWSVIKDSYKNQFKSNIEPFLYWDGPVNPQQVIFPGS